MRRATSGWLVGFVVVGIGACSQKTPNNLSDRSAASILQTVWKEEANDFYLGTVQFRPGPSSGKDASGVRFDSINEYPLYSAVAQQGLLRLEDEHDLTSSFSGRHDLFALSQTGVQRVATVSVTPEGADVGSVKRASVDDAWVTFVFGEYHIERIVSNEAIRANGDNYRVVQGTLRFEIEPLLRDAWTRANRPTAREWRFRALLMYDAFELTWKLQTADVGPRSVEFQTENVPAALAGIRHAGSH